MRMKRVVILIAVMSLLMIGIVSPTPARADGTQIAILVVAAVAGYVAIVFIATTLVHGSHPAWMEVAEKPPVDGKQPPAAMRSGPNCRQNSDDLTLACW